MRQGCPLSPLLYVLVAETLAVNIRCNARIPGLYLPGVPLVVSPVHQYADEATLILSTYDSIKAVFDIYSLRKLRALDLISPSLRVCSWVAGLAVWIPLWLWTDLRLNLRFLGFMWAWAISRTTTGVLEFVLLEKLCFLGVSVIFHSGAIARLWSLTPLPCHAFGMLHPLFTCLRGFKDA